ncbi:ADGRL2 [Mytilus coruscus]|uniref:ADGRL2 n=1 Tax=Mytilus coruscus TaxID=42192 RepID=A0A6J8BYI6_MYTCO|nr:ADGRL2 [Mytilus coruscus]
MVCVKLLVFWILLGLVKTVAAAFRETIPCGKNITSAGGELTIPNLSLEPCTWRFIRPNGEKISMNFKENPFCCFEIVVFNDMIDNRSVIFNGSISSGNRNTVPPVISINTSKALVSFRMFFLTEAPRFVLRYYSEASPDNKGSRFVIPDGNSFFVSTYNSQNVTVNVYCPSSAQDFNVSIDSTYKLTIRSNVIDLQADNDIVVYSKTQNNIPSAVMPLDVLGTNYIIISTSQNPRITVTGVGKTTNVNLTFPKCTGNCSLPACARQDISFKLHERTECQRLLHSCQVDLTGSIITSDLPVSVMVAAAYQILQVPPVNTWGRKFIIASFPGMFSSRFTLKMVSKKADTNVTILCYRPNATLETYDVYLKKSGKHVVQSISTDRNCLMKSNKPVLPVHIMTGVVENMFIIPPVEQYSSAYLLPAEFCYWLHKSLVIISETKYIDGLRMNGLPIAMNILRRQKIGETGYSSVFVNLGVSKLHLLRHIEQNVVFGVFLICSSKTAKHIIPLGVRMTPIAEVICILRNNDCDEFIDEDICDTNSADVNSNSDCAATSQEILPCLRYTDTKGVVWKTTLPNNYDYQTCGVGSTGQTSNFCDLKEGRYGVWKGPDTSLCVSESLSNIAVKLHLNLKGTSNVTLADILNETLTVTNKLISKDNFNAENLKSVIESLDLAVTIIEERSLIGITKRERENFLSVLDRLLSSVNEESWRTLNYKIKTTNHVSTIMNVVSRFGFQVNVNQSEDVILVRENIVLEAKKAFIDDVIFPNVTVLSSIYQQMTNARLFLSKDTIKNNLNGSIDYTAVYYRTLAKLLPSTFGLNVGSDVVSFSLPAFVAANNLFPPVQIGYEHVYSNKTNSTCVFWDFDKGIDGSWSTDGCYAEYRNTSYTSCRCDHFTNFAVLMSVYTFSKEDTTALTIITWPGLVTSILCLLITIFLHIYFWRNVNSDKSKILVCLCSVLVLAYIILLAGLNLTDNSSSCSAIAIVLHYLFLCALCLMVAEGIDIALSILIVFSQGRSNAGLLLSFGLVFPLVIVVISMAATKFKGYGTEKYCWLSVSNGLIYAFLVPCIVAVLTNCIISVLVLRKMFSTQAMMKKDTKEKVRAGVRSIAVLAPTLGLTWLFGILASHKDLIVFAYLFTILNSFQGLLIFIFHCLMNAKIQQAVKRKYDRFVQDHPWAKLKRKEKMDVSTVDTGVSKTTKTATGTESTAV